MSTRQGDLRPTPTQTTTENQNEQFNYNEYNGYSDITDSNDPAGNNVITRWLFPQIAEDEAMKRENYFVDKANAFNEYMWNKNNEYNSPEAQMERAKAAGINTTLAAGGIMGNGNATATPVQGAQGSVGMNTNAASPINELSTLLGGIQKGIEGTSKLGELIGFGKKNNAEIRNLETMADKAAEEADFTFWQKRQFRRTMRIFYDQAQNNLELTQQQIENLKAQYEVFKQQKWNIAADTNLKVNESGEVQQRTKNEWYEEQRLAFEKKFRDIYGVEITQSGLNMLVQAILSGKGDIIIDTLSDGIASMARQAKRNFRKNAAELLNPFDKETTDVFIKGALKIAKRIKKAYGKSRDATEATNKALKNYYKEHIKELKKYYPTYNKFLQEVRRNYTDKTPQLA